MDNHELTELIHRERTAVLVVNARSRSGARYFYRIYDALQRRGIEILAAYPVRDPSRLLAVIRRAIEHDSHLVVVGGGDGTISAVADAFVGTDTVMGLIPLGTGNSTARSLGIPLPIKRAVDAMLHGEVAEIDLGKIGDDYFVNAISIGLTAAATRYTSYRLKQYLGILAYPIVGIAAYLRHRPFQCRLQMDREEETILVREVVIANGRYYGDTVLSEDTSIRDGLLTVHAIEEMPFRALAWQLFRYLVLRQPGLPGRHHFSTTDVVIDADPPQVIDIDGEMATRTPAHFTIAPRALKVLLPRTSGL